MGLTVAYEECQAKVRAETGCLMGECAQRRVTITRNDIGRGGLEGGMVGWGRVLEGELLGIGIGRGRLGLGRVWYSTFLECTAGGCYGCRDD